MRKGHGIVGLTVISQKDGEIIGSVRDLVFDHNSNQLVALVLSDRDLFGLIQAQVVPWEEILTIGPDAIMVRSDHSKIHANYRLDIKRLMERDTPLTGMRVYTTDGKALGTLNDMYVDEGSGRVMGYELADCPASAATDAAGYLPARYTLMLGEDVALLPPEAARDLEAPLPDDESLAESPAQTQASAPAIGLVAEVPKESAILPRPADAGAESSRNPIDDTARLLEITVGQVAGRQVLCPNGSLLIAPGVVITRDIADQARRYGNEKELMAAAAAGMRAAGDAVSLPEQAGTLWTVFKKRLSTLRDTAQERRAAQRLEARIRQALGRPVMRAILDADDRVLLRAGDIITHHAVESARAAGALDLLLDSVYTGGPLPIVERHREHGGENWNPPREETRPRTERSESGSRSSRL